MSFTPEAILAVLDRCCDTFTFPMLDNGYEFLAATRLSLHRSSTDWAMVIEVFGFSPRGELPGTTIHTFASGLHRRDGPLDYVSREAYDDYLVHHPNDESRSVFPVQAGSWQDLESPSWLADSATDVVVRDRTFALPPRDAYARHGIELESAPRVQTFELCRHLAAVAREQVLATPQERRVSVRPDMQEILVLEEWHHPDIAKRANRPSGSETFRQLAEVLATGDVGRYRPSLPANTHWRHWPEGGRL